MKKFITLGVLTCALTMVFCTGSTVFVNQDYLKKQYYHKTLAIYPFPMDSILLVDFAKIAKTFKVDTVEPQKKMVECFYKQFMGISIDKLDRVTLIDTTYDLLANNYALNESNTFDTTVTLNSISEKFRIPKEEYLSKIGLNCDFILVVNRIKFTHVRKSNANQLVAQIKFIFWDYQRKQLISCGDECVVTDYAYFLSIRDPWTDFFDKCSKKIYKNVPFNNSLIKDDKTYSVYDNVDDNDSLKVIRLTGQRTRVSINKDIGIFIKDLKYLLSFEKGLDQTFEASNKPMVGHIEKKGIPGIMVLKFVVSGEGEVVKGDITYTSIKNEKIYQLVNSKISNVEFKPLSTKDDTTTFYLRLNFIKEEIKNNWNNMNFMSVPAYNPPFPK